MSELTATFPIRTATPESRPGLPRAPDDRVRRGADRRRVRGVESHPRARSPDLGVRRRDADRDGGRLHVPDDGPRRRGRRGGRHGGRRRAGPPAPRGPALADAPPARRRARAGRAAGDPLGVGERHLPALRLWPWIAERLVRDRPRTNGLAPAVGARGCAADGGSGGGARDVPAGLRADASRHPGRAEPERSLVALGDPARRRAHAARRRPQVPLSLRGRRRGRGLRDLPAQERLGRPGAEGPGPRRRGDGASRRARSARSGASCSAST